MISLIAFFKKQKLPLVCLFLLLVVVTSAKHFATIAQATGSYIPLEVESGTVGSDASVGSDVNASGGHYVQLLHNCSGPLTISTGGTYSGCYESTSPGTPAVNIATTSPVTLSNVTIRHAGKGIEDSVTGVQLTVTNATIVASDSGVIANQRAIELDSPASLIVEHNTLIDGQGIWIGASTPSTVRIRYNDVKNIGRYPHPTTGNCCVQFVQFDQITTGGAEIAWNRVMNTYLQSDVSDNINMYKSNGTSTSPIDIHDNLVSGAYPASGDGSDYAGGGILAGDSGGSYVNIHDNRVVSTSNYGVAITGGHDMHAYNNRVVNDGKADDGSTVGPSTAVGIPVWQYDPNAPTGPNANAYSNTIGWMTPGGTRSDTWLPSCDPSNSCTNNVSLSNPINVASESAERDGWLADFNTAGLQIGSQTPSVIATISAATTGDYRVWSRLSAPDTTNNSYVLQVDNGQLFSVGDASMSANTWTWVDYQNGDTNNTIDLDLTSGTHTVKIFSSEPNVKLDRLIFTTDTTCTPTGTGDNCSGITPTPTPTNTPTPTPTNTPTPTPTNTPTPTPTPVIINSGYTTHLTGSGSTDSGNNNGISATQVTSGASGGTLNSITIYIANVGASPNNTMQVAIYADNGSNVPGTRLGTTSSQALTANSWNTFTLAGISISANTKYWLAFNENSGSTQYGRASLTAGKSAWKIPTTYGTWPNPIGTLSDPIGSRAYSIYMTYTGN